jgi:aminoglycoside phosphotransferase (APT) family kinase protein
MMSRMLAPRLHADQVDIDVPTAGRLLTQQFPEFSDLPLRHVPSGGTDNAVFRIGEGLAMRMPLRPRSVDGLLKEVRWLPTVAPHLTLEVPQIVATGAPTEEYPFAWAVVRWLHGEDALTSRFASMRDAAEAIGRFVAELQRIEPVPAPGSEGFVRGRSLIGRDEAFRAALPKCAGLVDVRRVEQVWDDALSQPDWDGPPVWLHSDLIPGNILLRDGRVVGVLDFGAMCTGDPAYDATAAWSLFDRDHRPLFREIIGVDEPAWCRARGLVVSGGVLALSYYRDTNPSMVAVAHRGISEVLTDAA